MMLACRAPDAARSRPGSKCPGLCERVQRRGQHLLHDVGTQGAGRSQRLLVVLRLAEGVVAQLPDQRDALPDQVPVGAPEVGPLLRGGRWVQGLGVGVCAGERLSCCLSVGLQLPEPMQCCQRASAVSVFFRRLNKGLSKGRSIWRL